MTHATSFHNAEIHPDAFPTLTPDQRASVAELGTRRVYADGDVLFEQGERGTALFVIERGRVVIVGRSRDGDQVFADHGVGEFVGDMGTVTGEAAVGAAVADGPVEGIVLRPEEVQRLLAVDPVIGPLVLQAFLLRRSLLHETGYHTVRLIGSRWSEETQALRDFLAASGIPFRWTDPETDADAERLLDALQVGPDALPVVVGPGLGVMTRPALRDLAERLGVTAPLPARTYDLVVVGAGPAGLAAAVYGASEGLSTLLLDTTAPGGQAGASSRIENYLGFPTGLSGRDLAARATAQAQKFGVRVHAPARAVGMACEGAQRTILLEGEPPVVGRAVVVATGAAYRRLPAEGAERFTGTGVFYAATATEARLCEGGEVVVVGGGNAAGQAAVFLAQTARRVRVVVRRSGLAETMSRYLVDRIERSPVIALDVDTEVAACHGETRLEAVTLRGPDGERRVGTAAVFAMIGADPNTAWLGGCLALDQKGFVLTGPDAAGAWSEGRPPRDLETSRPGVFAVGDVRAGSVKRVASAIGEGSMAVQYVHGALAAV